MVNKRFRTAYTHNIDKPKMFTKKDKVVQALRDETDINKIFDSYVSTGCLPVVRNLSYNGAVIDGDKFVDAYNLVNKVQSDFNNLPSNLRAEFGNDVFRYLNEFSSAYDGDEKMLEKFRTLNIMSQETVDSVSASRSLSSLTPRGDRTEITSGVISADNQQKQISEVQKND